MLLACSTLALGASSQATGANVAMTQKFLDAARDTVLPSALAFLTNYPLPNPLVQGDQDTISYLVYNVKIANVKANAAITLSAPNEIKLTIANIQLYLAAAASAREDVWPHPSASGTVTADADGSSAEVVLTAAVSDGVPVVSMVSCNAVVNVNNIQLHGCKRARDAVTARRRAIPRDPAPLPVPMRAPGLLVAGSASSTRSVPGWPRSSAAASPPL